MLRVISSKLAQGTSGNLSVPHTNQEVLQPYRTLYDAGKNVLKNRQKEKQRAQSSQWQQSPNNPAQCRNCGKADAFSKNERNCQNCEAPRPRFSR